MNSIYDYLDYRDFLKDRITDLKAKGPAFSVRNLNRRAGLKSSGHLSLIINKRRNLGRDAMYKVSQGFGLNERESRFFVNLVNFNQAKTLEEQNHFYRRLLKDYPPKHSKLIDSKHYEIFSHWYYIAILELIQTGNFRSDPSWISKRLKPRVSEAKVKRALEDLMKLKLITENNGKIERGNTMIATPDPVRSVAVANFQEQLSKLAMKSLKKDAVVDKEFSTLTIAISKEDFGEVKRRIQEFIKELHSLLEISDKDKAEVAHINLQLFKLTSAGGANEED